MYSESSSDERAIMVTHMASPLAAASHQMCQIMAKPRTKASAPMITPTIEFLAWMSS
jgi:hypothetical protein